MTHVWPSNRREQIQLVSGHPVLTRQQGRRLARCCRGSEDCGELLDRSNKSSDSVPCSTDHKKRANNRNRKYHLFD